MMQKWQIKIHKQEENLYISRAAMYMSLKNVHECVNIILVSKMFRLL